MRAVIASELFEVHGLGALAPNCFRYGLVPGLRVDHCTRDEDLR
jgi:hypothetical protein